MSKGIDVDLILGIYDAFRRGDTAAILNQLDPKATLEFEGTPGIPWAGNRQGRDGWTKFFQLLA